MVILGIRATRAPKGVRAKLTQNVIEEAQNSVPADREKAARELIGPRGRLPSLKKDLIRLCVLMKVPVLENDTVEKIRKKLTPLVRALALKPEEPATTSASSAAPPAKTAPPKAQPIYTPPTRPAVRRELQKEEMDRLTMEMMMGPAAKPVLSKMEPLPDLKDLSSQLMAGQQLGRALRTGLKQTIEQGIAKVRRLASQVCTKGALFQALETCIAKDFEDALEEPLFYVPFGAEFADLAHRQGHLVKTSDEGKMATTLVCEPDYQNPGTVAGDVKLRLVAKRLGFRLKPYVDKSRPYVIILGKDAAKWQQVLWQVCPGMKDAGHYMVPFAKGNLLTNVDVISSEQEYLAKYGFKLVRMRVLSLLEKEQLKEPPELAAKNEVFANEEADGDPEPELEEDHDEMSDLEAPDDGKAPSKEMMRAVYKLHQNTGHVSKRRLAQAVIIAGAPAEAIKAAKMLKCSVCHEERRPKTRMSTALPRVEHPGDHVCGDLFSVKDAVGETFWIAHFVDLASRYQICRLLPNKTADEVVKSLSEWTRILGAPKALTVDMGPEFIAGKFQEACDFYDIVLHHTPVEAPWKNAIAERSGQTTKAILKHLVREHAAVGKDDVDMMLSAASEAYNGDVRDSGFSPAQFMLGKQPRTIGDGLALAPIDLGNLVSSNVSLAWQGKLLYVKRQELPWFVFDFLLPCARPSPHDPGCERSLSTSPATLFISGASKSRARGCQLRSGMAPLWSFPLRRVRLGSSHQCMLPTVGA